MKVEKIDAISLDAVQKVLASSNLTDAQKAQYVRSNRTKIHEIMETKITSSEFKGLMKNRPLKKFRPLKNSYTKWGDKIILAKALDIKTSEVPEYIKKVTQTLNEVDKLDFLPPSTLEMIKSYVYRHGSKDELVTFLDYELSKSKDIISSLYSTLSYYSGGIADYFIRPIHRMDNKTLVQLYNVIDKHIKKAGQNGLLSNEESIKLAQYALIEIYNIQNNSKLINAIKTYKTLS